MESMAYEGWRETGYQVIRDEKTSGRDRADQPTFTRDLVEDSSRFDGRAPGRAYNPDPLNENNDR